jgi:hypothetical protein
LPRKRTLEPFQHAGQFLQALAKPQFFDVVHDHLDRGT